MKKEIIFKMPSAITIFFSGILFLALMVVIAPVDYEYLGTSYSWLYVEMSLFALFFGLVIGSGGWWVKSKIIAVKIKCSILNKIFFMASALSAFGIILRVIDKYYIRGATFGANMMENRELISDAEINAFSVISSFFYPLVFLLPFVLMLLVKANLYKIHHVIIVLMLSLFPVIDGVLFGARSAILIFVCLILMYLYVLGFLRMKMTFNKLLLFFMFTILFFSFSGYLFDARTTIIGLDSVKSTQISGYAYFMPLNDSYVQLLESLRGSLVYYFALGFLNFVQYMGHGFFELLYLVDNFNTEYVLLGEQNFAVVVKFIYKILGIPFSFDTNNAVLVRTGIYNTLFGPIYYDFGFFGVILIFLFGIITGRTSYQVENGDIFLLPIYIYLLLILFFSLVVNMIIFGQGLYSLVSFGIFYVVSKFFYLNKRSIL
jgi:hypothetical protein